MKRKIELYGRLRDAGFGPSVSVALPDRCSARDALSAVKSAFGAKSALLQGCALATADEILSPSEPLPPGRLAILPPVCGG